MIASEAQARRFPGGETTPEACTGRPARATQEQQKLPLHFVYHYEPLQRAEFGRRLIKQGKAQRIFKVEVVE